MDVTILTNDISFLSDISETAHKRGLNAFWERVKKCKARSSAGIRNVDIVSISTGSIVWSTSGESDGESKNIDEFFESSKDDKVQGIAGNMEATDTDAMARKRGIVTAQIIQSLQKQIEDQGEREFKENRSYLQFDYGSLPSVNLNISSIDNACPGFKSLLRKWSRGRISDSHRLVLDLPEALDGTICSVSLDVVYKTMPFRLDSEWAKLLSEDLRLLCKSKIKVRQLVPISLVDSSMLYGVVMGIRAGLESDLDRHQEMSNMVQSLLAYLSLKDCALLIQSDGLKLDNKKSGLFHCNNQTLLLMAEELPAPLKRKETPVSGVLHRYATADQMLQESAVQDVIFRADTIFSSKLSEMIENSLDCLECKPVNPIYLDAKTSRAVMKEPTSSDLNIHARETIWTDDVGVGSREASTRRDDIDSLAFEPSKYENLAKIACSIADQIEDPWNDNVGVGSLPKLETQNSEEICDNGSSGQKNPEEDKSCQDIDEENNVPDQKQGQMEFDETSLSGSRPQLSKVNSEELSDISESKSPVKGNSSEEKWERSSIQSQAHVASGRKSLQLPGVKKEMLMDEELEWTDDSGDDSTVDEKIAVFDYSPTES